MLCRTIHKRNYNEVRHRVLFVLKAVKSFEVRGLYCNIVGEEEIIVLLDVIGTV